VNFLLKTVLLVLGSYYWLVALTVQ